MGRAAAWAADGPAAPAPARTRPGSGAGLALVAGEPETVYDPGVAEAPGGVGGLGVEGLGVEGLGGLVDPFAALAGLAEAVDRVAAAGRRFLSDAELLDHTAELDRLTTRLEAARTRALGEVDERGAHEADGCASAAAWYRLVSRRDPRAAFRAVLAAKTMGWLPSLAASVESGRATMDHLDAVASSAAKPHRRPHLVALQDTLVGLAEAAGPGELRVACRRVCDAVDPDGTDPADPASRTDASGKDERREFTHHRGYDGLGDLSGVLDPFTAERLDGLLAAYDQPPGEGDARTPAQRRHDAFDRILAAAETHPDASQVHGAPPRTLVTIDLLALLGCADLAARPARLGSGAEVDLGRALELAMLGPLTPVLMWGPYRPVGVGRSQRVLPDWLRPLMGMIHRHCRGVACDRPISWTQAAHLQDWRDGGDTDLDRTLPLCAVHHKLRDVVGWMVEFDPDTAQATWTSPDGQRRHTTQPPDP